MIDQFTKVDEVVAFASTMVPNSTPEDRDIWRSWAWLCLKRLPMPNTMVIDSRIYNDEGRFYKPVGMSSLIQFSLIDSNENEVVSTLLHRGKRIKRDNHQDKIKRSVEVYEDAYAYFIDSEDSEIVSYMNLKYKGFMIDEKNEPLIPHQYQECVINYIIWRAYQAKGVNDPSLQQAFFMEEARVKGNMKMPSLQEAKQIADRWVTLIPNYNDRY